MLPIKHSNIFKSRWVAVLWAAGIIWFAYDFAGPSPDEQSNGAATDAVQITDANGAPVSPDEAKQLDEALNRV